MRCTCICLSVCLSVSLSAFLQVHVQYLQICLYIYMYMSVSVCLCPLSICTCLSVHVCLYMHVHVRVHIALQLIHMYMYMYMYMQIYPTLYMCTCNSVVLCCSTDYKKYQNYTCKSTEFTCLYMHVHVHEHVLYMVCSLTQCSAFLSSLLPLSCTCTFVTCMYVHVHVQYVCTCTCTVCMYMYMYMYSTEPCFLSQNSPEASSCPWLQTRSDWLDQILPALCYLAAEVGAVSSFEPLPHFLPLVEFRDRIDHWKWIGERSSIYSCVHEIE